MALSLMSYIYVLCVTPWHLSRFLIEVLLYALPWGRPAKEWNANQAIRVRVVRLVLLYISLLRLGDRLKLKPGREKDRFVTLQPASPKLYRGPADDAALRPQPLGATWTPSKPPAKVTADTTVALHFHGGGYVIGDGRDHDAGFTAKMLVRRMGCSHVLAPQYRLASSDGGRFPAPLQDALTAYVHLLREARVPASQVVFSGDSAGGNMALGLLRYVAEHGAELGLPQPAGAVLWSPWVDLEAAIHADIRLSANRRTDYINGLFGRWGATTVSGEGLHAPGGPYLSPMHHPFKPGNVPIFVQTGDREVLYPDDVLLAERYQEAGVRLELLVTKGGPHDILLLGDKMGFVAEAREAADKARMFLTKETRLRLKAKTG